MSRTYSEPEKLLLRGMGLPLLAKVRYIELQGKNPYYPLLYRGKTGKLNPAIVGCVFIRPLDAPVNVIEEDIVHHLLDCGLLSGDLDDDGGYTGCVFLTDWGREFVNGALMNLVGSS